MSLNERYFQLLIDILNADDQGEDWHEDLDDDVPYLTEEELEWAELEAQADWSQAERQRRTVGVAALGRAS